MSSNNKWAAWQNLLHKPVEIVTEEPVKALPKVEKIPEALQPVEDVTEHELDGIVAKPEIKKIKKTKIEQ